MSADEYEGWCLGLLSKYPASTLAIIAALCEAGLRKGEISANDISGVSYPDPHLVGATFKLMKRIGFAKSDRIVASTRPASHSSFVLVWTLADASKAELFLSECRAVLVRQEKQEQMLMAM